MKQKYASATVNVILPFCILLGAIACMLVPHPALSQSGSSLIGWAWSETIGWISVSCTDTSSCAANNYGMSIASDGTISGYGWSENVGWISANAADLAGCPQAPCTASLSGGTLHGWWKALAPGQTTQAGGWDGWISLSGAGYGPVLQNTGYLLGFLWGNVVTGWIDSHLISTNYQPCTLSFSCGGSTGQTIIEQSAQCQISSGAACAGTDASFCSSGSAVCLVSNPGFVAGPNTTGHLQVAPAMVRSGQTATLYWNVSHVKGCTVTGTNGQKFTSTSSGASGQTTIPITAKTTYTLHCNALDGAFPTAVNEQATISLVPLWQEI